MGPLSIELFLFLQSGDRPQILMTEVYPRAVRVNPGSANHFLAIRFVVHVQKRKMNKIDEQFICYIGICF